MAPALKGKGTNMQGIVKSFGTGFYGFITGSDAGKYFFHGRSVA
jgi:hypothetical protein